MSRHKFLPDCSWPRQPGPGPPDTDSPPSVLYSWLCLFSLCIVPATKDLFLILINSVVFGGDHSCTFLLSCFNVCSTCMYMYKYNYLWVCIYICIRTHAIYYSFGDPLTFSRRRSSCNDSSLLTRRSSVDVPKVSSSEHPEDWNAAR